MSKKAVPNVADMMIGRTALRRHSLLLDAAIDRHTSEILFQKRELGSFAGVALVTDESPPGQPRFRGLRFQITVMHSGTFLPSSSWMQCSSPPIQSTAMLADLMHCPGKKGTDVSRVLEWGCASHLQFSTPGAASNLPERL